MIEELDNLTKEIFKENLDVIAPNFRKGILSNEEIDKILKIISFDIGVDKSEALVGTILLMLKGAASTGTPDTLSVDLKNGKKITKKNVKGAYFSVTGNNYIRRLAEGLAIQIGNFAEHFQLNGELAQRINTMLKAQTGETLTAKEMAWCSSFSQNIPDLASRGSDRLVKLLAEDYKKRFENKKRGSISEYLDNKRKKK